MASWPKAHASSAGTPAFRTCSALIGTFFGMGSAQLLPAIATDRLGQGAPVLGLISAAAGAGALLSTLVLVPMAQRIARVGWAMAEGVAWAGIWLTMVGISPWTWLSTAAMFLCALGTPVANTTANALLQMLAPEHMRAWLLSVWMIIIFGTQPFAAVVLGYLAHLMGVPRTIVLCGAAMVVVALVLLLVRPELRRWEPVRGPRSSTSSTAGKVAKGASGLAQGILWLGATALALVSAKYAWQRAQQSLKNTTIDPKYIETAEKMVDSVVGSALRH
jgi:MFS family permease